MTQRSFVFLGLIVLASGCSCSDDVVATRDAEPDAPSSLPDGSPPDARPSDSDAAADDAGDDAGTFEDGSLASFCAGDGPIVIVGDEGTGASVCTGTIAEATFRNALCSCQDYVSSFSLRTDSFDSSQGPYSPTDAETGASVGVNGNWNSTAENQVGGSLTVAGASGMTFSDDTTVRGNLRVAGRVDHSGATLSVTNDAWIGGDVVGSTFMVTGTLTQPAGRSHPTGGASQVGQSVTGDVVVPPPCACDDVLDVPALVAHYATDNDNATLPLDPARLQNHAAGTELELPCGRFYFSDVHGSGALTLRITARTAIFITGDLRLGGDFRVELVGPDAEVDLFVSGNVVAPGAFVLGDATAPARARLYVGGTGTVQLSGSATAAGNIYAPHAELVAAGGLELFGSVLAERVASTGDITVHYDRAINLAGTECPPPPVCAGCGDCGSLACVGGQCADCTGNGDCCDDYICEEGRCVVELL